MRFSQLAQYFSQLELVSGRLKMTKILADLFTETSEAEITPVVYLSLGQLGPKYSNPEFNMADKMVLRSISQAYEAPIEQVTKLYKKLGDVGEVVNHLAETSKLQNFKTSKLTVSEGYEHLLKIAHDEGKGSQDRKVQVFAELLQAVDPISAKYFARIPVGKLRLGFSDMTILDALSWMVAGDKSLHSELEDAYNMAADIGLLAKKVKQKSQKSKVRSQKLKSIVKGQLSNVEIKIGVPIVAALCQRLKSFDEMIDKMGEAAIEPKYDGTRLQIHWKRVLKNDKANLETSKLRNLETIKTFTRNLEENSHMFPELQHLTAELPSSVQSIILDCEAVGYDPKTNKPVPFQMTISRKRKHGIEEQRAKVGLKFMVFDVLYLNGIDLHSLPLQKRREKLERLLSSSSGAKRSREGEREPSSVISTRSIKKSHILQLAPQTVTSNPGECRKFHHQYLKQGLEGVVVKKWSSPYTPGRKGWHWVKMKEVETARAGLIDTLDCVVMGYYRGRGQRAKFGLGAFLVGVRHSGAQRSGAIESQSDVYLTVSKIGTGLTDAQFRDLAKRLNSLETKEKPQEYDVHKNLIPDVWVEPSLVVEIAADNITKSPTHTAGLALRFPRLVKLRDDKSPGQASTLIELNHMYELQK